MRISKSELLRIIQEEKNILISQGLLNEQGEWIGDDMLVHEKPEDVEAAEEIWAGGENILNSVDHAAAFHGAEETIREPETLSLMELKKIIIETVAEYRYNRK
jgi:hypothetical protein